jgi:hypothetical protein
VARAVAFENMGTPHMVARPPKNVHKRYLVHIAGYNLCILMRVLFGAGTPKEEMGPRKPHSCSSLAAETITVVIVAASDKEVEALLIISFNPNAV